MAELEYFAANDPLTFKRRGGRILTAGVLLLLVGLGLGLMTTYLGTMMYRYRHDIRREWLYIGTVWLTMAAYGAALLVGGVGLLMRRRWSLPVAHVTTAPWLTFGTAVVAASVTLQGVRSPTTAAGRGNTFSTAGRTVCSGSWLYRWARSAR